MNTELKRGDVVLVDLGATVGSEQAKTRPCVVVQTVPSFRLAVVVPFTSQAKPYYSVYTVVKTPAGAGGLPKESFALCHQVRAVSFERSVSKFGSLPARDFNRILTVLASFLDV